jgi:hypothetical protein
MNGCKTSLGEGFSEEEREEWSKWVKENNLQRETDMVKVSGKTYWLAPEVTVVPCEMEVSANWERKRDKRCDIDDKIDEVEQEISRLEVRLSILREYRDLV